MSKDQYTPFFGKMLTSSIWSEPLHVRVLWVSMLLSQGKGNVVAGNEFNLHRMSNLSVEEVKDGLAILMSPDRLRPDQPNDGRRLEKVEGGWRVLNGEHYQNEFRLICAKARVQKHRAKMAILAEANAEKGGNP